MAQAITRRIPPSHQRYGWFRRAIKTMGKGLTVEMVGRAKSSTPLRGVLRNKHAQLGGSRNQKGVHHG